MIIDSQELQNKAGISTDFKIPAVLHLRLKEIIITASEKKRTVQELPQAQSSTSIEITVPDFLVLKEGQYVTKDSITGAYTVHEHKKSTVKVKTPPVKKPKMSPVKGQAKSSAKESEKTSAKAAPQKSSIEGSAIRAAPNISSAWFSLPWVKDERDWPKYECEQEEKKKWAAQQKKLQLDKQTEQFQEILKQEKWKQKEEE